MAFATSLLRPPSPRTPSLPRLDEYDSSSSTDSPDTVRTSQHHPRPRASFASSATGSSGPPPSDFLFPPTLQSAHSSVSSTATSTPVPSRSVSPLPQFFQSTSSSTCTSDTDSEPSSPLLRSSRNQWWRDDRRRWWTIGSRRRRKRDGRIVRTVKKWTRRILRHPFFPRQPITIILTLLLLSVFAIFLTLLLIHILNPDKEPLPWRAYCSVPASSIPPDHFSPSSSYSYPDPTSSAKLPPFPPANLDTLPPAGIFIGVFSIDSAFDRRMLVRTTWASHPRSRYGASVMSNDAGTSRTIVRFIVGQPRKGWQRRMQLEMDMYNDIVILPVPENMNGGKTYSFFSWASINAWVPPLYTNTTIPIPHLSYSNYTSPPPPLAPHDPFHAWKDQTQGILKPWVRPDYVVKVDDDSFVMLAELESRLRLELHVKPQDRTGSIAPHTSSAFHLRDDSSVANLSKTTTTETLSFENDPLSRTSRSVSGTNPSRDPLIYWGYLVTNRLNRFMAGELYALSWSLVNWVSKDPAVKSLTKGAEDKQTAKWMRLHPRASEVRWSSERCWIYDHPRSGTVYSHGFLFPSEVTRVRRSLASYPGKMFQDVSNNPAPSVGGNNVPTPSAWAYSSVSTFGVRYTPPIPDLTSSQSIEALVEGSDMSMIREGSPMTPQYAWIHREGRNKRYGGNRVGGTVVVHFIKKHVWFLETAIALLEGEEYSESEKFQWHETAKAALGSPLSPAHSATFERAVSQHRRR